MYNICSVGMLACGTWKLINKVEDPELRSLASRLPNTILHSHADSTVKKYRGAFRRWKTWAVAHKLLPIPAKSHEFVLYLREETRSKSAAEEPCNALSWVHSTFGLVSPSTHPLVKAALVGLQHSLAKPVIKKEPMTIEMTEAVVLDAELSGSLSDMNCVCAGLRKVPKVQRAGRAHTS